MTATSAAAGRAAPRPERAPTRVLVRFGLGDFAQAVLTGLITSYVLVVFVPQAHSSLPVLLPAAALTFALVRGIGSGLDAFLNPLVASWSDRIRARGGRRTVMLRWAALPWAVTTALVVFTPFDRSSGWNTLWVAVFLSLYYIAGTFFLVPYFALVAELVTEVRRRVWFYTINTLFFVIGSAIVFVTPTLQSLLVGAGFSELAAWRFAFALFGAIGFLAAVVPAFTIDERRYVHAEAAHTPLLASFAATFRYRGFRVLVGATFVMQVAFSLFNATLLYYITMLVGQPQLFATIVPVLAIVVGVSSYPLVNWLARRVGKRPLMVAACVTYVVIYFAIYLYRYTLEGAVPGALFAILIGLLIGVPISITNIIPPAAFADLTQFDTIRTGQNRAGMFFAARNFVTSLSQTVVLLVVPGLISLGSTDGRATVDGVQLTALVSGVFIAAALALFAFYDDREVIAAIERHTEESVPILTV
ncbi:MFS transporter [Gryllotalpicola protaetiae]|uniref:MFS transporter n=1 Tax=Gryllotalpicola protaetiae TaxID=2419771 RepID=A0A387BP37_9MICO|nr:MFS transporter [Gryllotalpicola protaetiae]AYG03804.1 MFS transporter [Gryllotalpicola protaetiae]